MADYAGVSLFEAEDIDYYTWRVLLRDAVIHALSATDRGREYLDKCWTLEQTAPDRKKLREKIGITQRKEADDGGR